MGRKVKQKERDHEEGPGDERWEWMFFSVVRPIREAGIGAET